MNILFCCRRVLVRYNSLVGLPKGQRKVAFAQVTKILFHNECHKMSFHIPIALSPRQVKRQSDDIDLMVQYVAPSSLENTVCRVRFFFNQPKSVQWTSSFVFKRLKY